jgi:acetoin utilization deacetylase AcuC-like enzyme
MDLTDADFATLTRILKAIANKYSKGRIVSALEGGYNLEGIAKAARSHVQELMRG